MILAVSDLHMNQRWMDWVRRSAVNYDAVILAGDTANQALKFPRFPTQCVMAEKFLGALRARENCAANDGQTIGRKRIFYCSGNHDYDPEICEPPPIWLRAARASRGTHIAIDSETGVSPCGARILCAPDGATFWEPWITAVDILVTHTPPSGTKLALCRGAEEGYGCDRLVAHVTETEHPPSLVICGHAHDPAERVVAIGRTTFVNVASGFDVPHPPHCIIDWPNRMISICEYGKASIAVSIAG